MSQPYEEQDMQAMQADEALVPPLSDRSFDSPFDDDSNDNEFDEPTLSQNERPSKFKVIVVVLVGLIIIGSIVWGSWFAYERIFAKPDQISTSYSPTLNLTPAAATVELDADSKEEAIYPIEGESDQTESFIGKDQIVHSSSNVQKNDSSDELSKLNYSLDKLAQDINALTELNKQLLSANQELFTLVQQQGQTQTIDFMSVKESLDGVIVSSEQIAKSISLGNVTPKKAVSSTPAKQSELSSEQPSFRVVEPSIWGDSVKFGIEQSNGFYRTVERGDEVEGWQLISFDLKRKTVRFKKNGVEHEMHYA
ncbi:TPA: hypothetical protein I7C77_003468 [Vibrio cholerae]|nr:hypothetical protein [Vibrio cholerae]